MGSTYDIHVHVLMSMYMYIHVYYMCHLSSCVSVLALFSMVYV